MVSATSREQPSANLVTRGVTAQVLPRLSPNLVSIPLSAAIEVGSRFIQSAATQGVKSAAGQMGLSITSESEYDAISDLLWRNVVSSSPGIVESPVVGSVETAFKRVINKIVFSTETRRDSELDDAFSKYLKERGVTGFVQETLTEYLNSVVLEFLRSGSNESEALNGSLAFHRKKNEWRSYEEEEDFRTKIRASSSKLAEEVCASLREYKFFDILLSKRKPERLQKDLAERLENCMTERLTGSRRS